MFSRVGKPCLPGPSVSADKSPCKPCLPDDMAMPLQIKPEAGPLVPVGCSAERAPASLPAELWQQVWGGLDQGFHGGTGTTPELHRSGTCKCGKLKFRADGNLAASFLCHCHMCRKYWAQGTPQHVLWVRPENAVTITEGQEYHKTWTMKKLSHNLRGEGHIHFAGCCGTVINVNFSDPNGTFTLLFPYNFTYDEWGDLKTQRGNKARHGLPDEFLPRFHAHYENRSHDHEDTLPKLADIWLEDMPLMNNAGDIVSKVTYPMPGFEKGWSSSPVKDNLIGVMKSKL